ncbi:MAG: hypothetical protein ONB48_17065 [candidate division KSB1 bacterium]|nr:hypothetical protein [candidate division KSB1 bacterium]MDZ7275189.1 hypothetical protein [candidate division KSB1 bacterium]MDZ7287358.1 hypothetical protein [candidate division KSB1 bacterium]MDZ7299472.1 hypothetical protein [candidate division KSB1 bacterium]MDZ7305482.1 hypothetical protein [candidate division KSB1 bacterium]
MQCYSCGTEILLEGKPGRRDTCPKCAAYLHCCRNCRFYDVNAHHQCREPQAEWVQDKEMGNFCDYFEAAAVSLPPRIDRAAEARKKLDQLFKK